MVFLELCGFCPWSYLGKDKKSNLIFHYGGGENAKQKEIIRAKGEPDTGQYIVNLHTGNFTWMASSTTTYCKVELLTPEDSPVSLFDIANFQIIERGKAKGK